jgi:hypothetical protein
MAIEINRIGFALAFGKLEHLAYRVDQKAERFTLRFDADRHRPVTAFASPKSEPDAQFDGGDNAAAQIENTGDLGAGKRHPRNACRFEDILNTLDRQTEHLSRRRECHVIAELGSVGHGHAA